MSRHSGLKADGRAAAAQGRTPANRLYLFLAVFSRKVVGWEVFTRESAEQAATVFSRAYHREGGDARAPGPACR